jgi:anti-sigma regulatory factor (Ser/Thr protein kinase)
MRFTAGSWGHDGAFFRQSNGKLSLRFEPGPSAAAAARNALVALQERVDEALLEDLRLLVSELVTNSVRHSDIAGSDSVSLDVALQKETVHVEVCDPGAGFEPRPRAKDDERVGGWGLFLVDKLADRWGVMRNGRTKVWFEIDRQPAGRPRSI